MMGDLDQAVHNSWLGAFSSALSSFRNLKVEEPDPGGDIITPLVNCHGETRGFLQHRSNTRINLPRLSQPLCVALC